MDKKNLIPFLMLSALVLAAWYAATFFLAPKKAAEPAPQPIPGQAEQQGVQEGPALAHPAADQAPALPEGTAPASEVPLIRGIVLENDKIKTSWTNRGAALQYVQLKEFQAPYFEKTDGKERPVLTLVRDFEEGRYSDAIEGVTFRSLEDAPEQWSHEEPTSDVRYRLIQASPERIVFEGILAGRLKVRKTVTIAQGAYNCDVTLEFSNLGREPLRFDYRLRGAMGIEQEDVRRPSMATAVAHRDGNGFGLQTVRAATVAKKGTVQNEGAHMVWAAAVNQYFVAATRPVQGEWIRSVSSEVVTDTEMLHARGRWTPGTLPPNQEANRAQAARSKAAVIMQSTPATIPAGGSEKREYQFICAPKLDSILEQYGQGMPDAISLGWFRRIGLVMLAILRFFYRLIPNYGVAILLLTVVMRIALHPLTRKSQIGMRKMQLLQPKIAEMKRKYGDDRERFTREQMEIFRRYGVHPMGGCWPMMLQMPVFIALFGTLRSAIELRQAHFIPGWISDLSQPDAVVNLGFYIPMLNWNTINILPFLMVAASLLSQQMMPKPTDPQAQKQQKMMKYMPAAFALILYNFPSGLLLYWTTSTSIGILESWLIRRRMEGMELKPVDEQRKAAKGARPGTQPAKRGLLDKLMGAMEQHEKKSRLQAAKKKREQ